MTPETKTKVILHYLFGGAVLALFGGIIIGMIPFVICQFVLDINCYEDHPTITLIIAFIISTIAFASYIWWEEEIKPRKQAKFIGRSVNTQIRGYYVSFGPDGTREVLGKIAGH